MGSTRVRRLTVSDMPAYHQPLVALLQDAVHSGASVGYLPPLTDAEAASYWETVLAGVRDGSRILLVAEHDGRFAGTVQLVLESRPNGNHRAEVSKLLVHSTLRRNGVGRALMHALEAQALAAGRTTLILDTRLGDPSERLYASLGYVKAGVVPAYVRNAEGEFEATVFYYKILVP